MPTLNDAIQSQIASIEARGQALKADYDTAAAAIEAELTAAKANLTGLGPWLEHESTAAKDAMLALFGKLGL